jgi:pimeloyl-ACP methyl ester carboxylesterase
MTDILPVVLVPGLLCSPRLYGEQIPALWQQGAVVIADHRRDDNLGSIARRILDAAPQRFALAGLSMGGYIAFEIMRQAPDRVLKLALLDTTARSDTPDASERRRAMIALAESGRFSEIPDLHYPAFVHPSRLNDESLKRVVREMADETRPDAYIRQQTAIMARPDSRPTLAAIRCQTLVLVGDSDALTPPAMAKEIAQGISGSRLVVVPDCGHLSTLEQPEAVTRAMMEWFSG